MTTLVHRRTIVSARVYCSAWIVDCPYCSNAELLDFGSPIRPCGNCRVEHEIAWPTRELAVGITRLLMLRRDPNTRNWFPGETLTDLLGENMEHGIGPSDEGQVISIMGDTIIRDTLPATIRTAQIGA